MGSTVGQTFSDIAQNATTLLRTINPRVQDIVETFVKAMTKEMLSQIEFVGTDTPSGKLYHLLKTVCPNLKSLCLDPVHIVITYNSAHWKHHTDGQTFLRRIQSKFCRADYGVSDEHWGALYTGQEAVEFSPVEDPSNPKS